MSGNERQNDETRGISRNCGSVLTRKNAVFDETFRHFQRRARNGAAGTSVKNAFAKVRRLIVTENDRESDCVWNAGRDLRNHAT